MEFEFEDGDGANTRISYEYRDGSNYRAGRAVVLAGRISPEDAKRMNDALDGGEFFLPGQVGLPHLHFGMIGGWGEDDHVWHKLETISFTDDPADPALPDAASFLSHWPEPGSQWRDEEFATAFDMDASLPQPGREAPAPSSPR